MTIYSANFGYESSKNGRPIILSKRKVSDPNYAFDLH